MGLCSVGGVGLCSVGGFVLMICLSTLHIALLTMSRNKILFMSSLSTFHFVIYMLACDIRTN